MNVAKELAGLNRMSVGELQAKYAEVFGEKTNGRHRQWLVKRIVWRMQANAEGDLSDRARKRAAELANDADLRVMAPRQPKESSAGGKRVTKRVHAADKNLPLPGTLITREYKGETITVKVLRDGFEYEGERYSSLSAVAKAVTGSHWSGHRFFGLQQGGGR
jgi:hypothetical protein